MKVAGFSRFLLIPLTVSVFGLEVGAQPSKTKPKPLATPPILSGAEIISRADDDLDALIIRSRPAEKPAEKPVPTDADLIKELSDRIKKLEASQKADKDEKQKRLLLNLDILTRAEQRSESLRKQLFEMIEKENTVKNRLDQIELDIRPEIIERALQLNGSMKPEELRESRRRSLNAERQNLQSLMAEIQSTRSTINLNLQKSEIMVEKIRVKLEKDIDDSFLKDDTDNP